MSISTIVYWTMAHWVKVEGFIIDRPTKFVVELSEITKDAYDIKECLIPGIQDVVVVDKISDDSVTLTDKDTGEFPKDYNFIIIAKGQAQSPRCDLRSRRFGIRRRFRGW